MDRFISDTPVQREWTNLGENEREILLDSLDIGLGEVTTDTAGAFWDANGEGDEPSETRDAILAILRRGVASANVGGGAFPDYEMRRHTPGLGEKGASDGR